MHTSFAGPERLLSWAHQQIVELDRRVLEYVAARPFQNIVATDILTGERTFSLRLSIPFPAEDIERDVRGIVGYLRDALDHACNAAACIITGKERRSTGFPFGDTAAAVKARIESKKLEDNPKELHDLLASFRPYLGGNDNLWNLNQLRNPGTHRFIVPVGHAVQLGTITLGSGAIMSNSQIGYSKWDPVRSEIEYMRLGRGSHIECNVEGRLSVVFDGLNGLSGAEVLPTLSAIAEEVDRVVNAISAETKRVVGT